MRRSIGGDIQRAIIADHFAVKVGQAVDERLGVNLDAAKIYGRGLNRCVAEQDLHDLQRVEVGRPRGLPLKAHQHGHCEGVAEPVSGALQPRPPKRRAERGRQAGSCNRGAAAVEEEHRRWPVLRSRMAHALDERGARSSPIYQWVRSISRSGG